MNDGNLFCQSFTVQNFLIHKNSANKICEAQKTQKVPMQNQSKVAKIIYDKTEVLKSIKIF